MDGSVGSARGGRKRPPLATAAIMLGALSFASTLAAIALAAVASRLYSPDPRVHWLSVWATRAFLVAVTCGVLGMALGAVARRGGRVGAYGIAFAVIAAVLLPLWIRKPEAQLKMQCLGNVKELALAVSMYASDWDRYPDAAHWSDAVLPYVQAGVELRKYGPDIAPRGPASEETVRRVKETYRCPDAAAECAYAYNATLSRLFDGDLSAPEKVIAVFESDRGWDAHGGKELLPIFPRHFGGDNISFADGHARWYARQKPREEVRWDTVWPREYEQKGELQWQAARTRGAIAPTSVQATTPTAVGDPFTHPAKLGLLSPDYSVVRAFIEAAWTTKGPLQQGKAFSGQKPQGDTHLGPWTFPGGESLPGLGDAVTVVYLGGSDHLYRDRHGVRLIVETHTFPDTLILSAQCKHKAKLVHRDLGSLRTESGVGLGDLEARLLKRLGTPSRWDRFREYTIFWYLQKPKHVVTEASTHEYDEGHAAAYALKGGRVVEIWLHEWDNEPIG